VVSNKLIYRRRKKERKKEKTMSALLDTGTNKSADTGTATTTRTILDAVEETMKKVEASLLPAIDSFCNLGTTTTTTNGQTNDDTNENETNTAKQTTRPPSTLGLDFLHVKNTLLLSYLIELVVQLRDTVDPPPSPQFLSSSAQVSESTNSNSSKNENSSDDSDSDSSSDEGREEHSKKTVEDDDEEDSETMMLSSSSSSQDEKQRRRLLEMRTVLDKTRGLDKKLRYQIDKLLSSLTNSTTFATVLHNNNNNNRIDDDDDVENSNSETQFGTTHEDDPLKYRPDPNSMLDDVDDDDEDDADDDNDEQDEESDDDDLAAARATLSFSKQSKSNSKNKSKEVNVGKSGDGSKNDDYEDSNEQRKRNEKYIAPRSMAVPYTLDVADKQSEKAKRDRRKLRATELAQTLRQQYGDQPDTEDVFGGGKSEFYGKQRTASKALAQREAERTEFEESTMVRLTTSRKDKKEKKRIQRMMEGGANLAQIANLGNLVRETQAFGRSTTNSDNDDDEHVREEAYRAFVDGEQSENKNNDLGEGSRHANGKRRRDPTTDNRSDGAGRRLKMGKRPKAYNSLQAAFFGSGDGGNKPTKKKGKKSRR